ncbi:hypothetical protein H4R18_003431 [Coemansia javaensis]|uniref:Importin N-terminal domain-containing protein n=1 Tax=Coemansia javaensis TaxID=2761396 RepID=A0A9W8LIF4_9FUNG|nr:hypothetical protein H4R18_003431 [Coemansia javaensis]
MDPQFVSNLQGLLQKLASASDTDTIQAVTAALGQQFYTVAGCVPALLAIAKDDQQWQVRQLAAVELRKRITKFWDEIDDGTQQQMRDALLAAVVDESSAPVRHALARAIAAAAYLDIPKQKWGELFQFLYKLCQSPAAAQREIGAYMVDALCETIAVVMEAHMKPLLELIAALANDGESLAVRVSAIEALGKMADFVESGDRPMVAAFQSLVPTMVQTLQRCLETGDEDSASSCFEVLNGMVLSDVPFLNRHLGEMVGFSINVGASEELSDSLRIMALNFLVWTASYKRGRLQKLKVVGQLIDKMMPITALDDPADDDDDSPSRIITEGGVDYMRPQVGDFVTLICAGLSDPDTLVRRASCMALGCIAGK